MIYRSYRALTFLIKHTRAETDVMKDLVLEYPIYLKGQGCISLCTSNIDMMQLM